MDRQSAALPTSQREKTKKRRCYYKNSELLETIIYQIFDKAAYNILIYGMGYFDWYEWKEQEWQTDIKDDLCKGGDLQKKLDKQ